MTDYRNPAIRQLKDQQVRFAPLEKRQEQLNRLERLLAEVEPNRTFPYQYVCFRITDYRTEQFPKLLISGADLEHDLRLFIRDLAETVPPVPLEDVPEEVLTLDDLADRLKVSTKTLNRWRHQGLVTRWVLSKGRRKVAVRQSLLQRFLDANKDRVERGSRFSQMSAAERARILARARRLARIAPHRFMDICQRIARKMNRSVETIRYTLKNHDRANPRSAIFARHKEQLSAEDKQAIYNAYRRGMGVEALADRFSRTRTSILRIINEVRAQRLKAQLIDYIPHESFDDSEEAAAILAPMPNLAEYEASRAKARSSVPTGLPPELATLYEVPLLSREQEAHLFRKMNFLKHQAAKLRDRMEPGKARTADLEQIEAWLLDAQAIKEQLISANMRLVVSIAKRHVNSADNFFELLSDGNLSLIKAVDKFDYSRGFKFSTYASWAIMKNFARSIPEEKVRRDRYMTGSEEMFEFAADNRSDERAALAGAEQAKREVNRLLDTLSERERRIMQLRFGLDAEQGLTLEQVGKDQGITKERVRQLEARSLSKLRQLVRTENVEAQ
ncbi:MAG TPA: sigma-70 family RNA polymerase sigma factor [Gemmatales bacterium]|nr:sigma-70 family RNA polymerase sigma factor [Gemmatales bacterium]HMP57987.1 sigma-70 family RNA polymerase sigma factor [Gemmatales bacterium]